MDKSAHFLITNDDGISAKGLYHLWKSVKDMGKTTVFAPKYERTGFSQAFTIGHIETDIIDWKDGKQATVVDGTPVDCVKIAVEGNLVKPTLILSGINHGHNFGETVLYSGTIGAIIQGHHLNVTGIAFSSFDENEKYLDDLEPFIQEIVQYVLENPQEKPTLYNVNLPKGPASNIKGIKLIPVGRSRWHANYSSCEKQKFYTHVAQWTPHEGDQETDCFYCRQGYITVSPIKVSELTDHDFLQKEKSAFENRLNQRFSTLIS